MRIETFVNHPYDFKVYRSGIPNGQQVMGWFPLSKNVRYLYRYQQIARTANGRYLDALPSKMILSLHKIICKNLWSL